MRQRLVPVAISSRQASLCSLALTLGMVVGCGTASDETPAARGPGVASVKQAFDQIFQEPYMGPVSRPPSCEDGDHDDERNALLAADTPDDTRPIEIGCRLKLTPSETIKRRIRFGASSSGVTIDCQDQL